jgi:type IV pilus assembly protein PilV
MSRRRQCGMFMLQSVMAMALFSVGALAVLMLSANAKRQSADAHNRAVAGMLVAELAARMRLGPRDAATLAAYYGEQGAGAARFGNDAAQVLPGVAGNPPAIAIGGNGAVVITLRWKAPGDIAAHQYVAVTRIAE